GGVVALSLPPLQGPHFPISWAPGPVVVRQAGRQEGYGREGVLRQSQLTSETAPHDVFSPPCDAGVALRPLLAGGTGPDPPSGEAHHGPLHSDSDQRRASDVEG